MRTDRVDPQRPPTRLPASPPVDTALRDFLEIKTLRCQRKVSSKLHGIGFVALEYENSQLTGVKSLGYFWGEDISKHQVTLDLLWKKDGSAFIQMIGPGSTSQTRWTSPHLAKCFETTFTTSNPIDDYSIDGWQAIALVSAQFKQGQPSFYAGVEWNINNFKYVEIIASQEFGHHDLWNPALKRLYKQVEDNRAPQQSELPADQPIGE